jgi:hypothetical protein
MHCSTKPTHQVGKGYPEQGFVELFPVWPTHAEPAAFQALLVKGGFEVSAQSTPAAGVASPVLITSNAGMQCALVHPWESRNTRGARTMLDGDGSSQGGVGVPNIVVHQVSTGEAVPIRWTETSRGIAVAFNTSIGSSYTIALDA